MNYIETRLYFVGPGAFKTSGVDRALLKFVGAHARFLGWGRSSVALLLQLNPLFECWLIQGW